MSPRYIWDQRPKPGDNDPTLNMLHQTDTELFTVIERQCGWDLATLKKSAPQLVKASISADSVAEGVSALSSQTPANKTEQTLVDKTAARLAR